MPGQVHRAWRVHRHGTPYDALRLDEVPTPQPAAGEVRVLVEAIGLNFPDLLLCRGAYQERPDLPFTPGFEAAGTVVDADGATPYRNGQRVIVVPELPDGALQESLTVPAAQLYPIPAGLPVRTAAALHIAYQTAYVALHHRAGLRPGETVLVLGAAGGVGSAAVQLAHAFGARVVAAATGAGRAAACRRLGADETVDLAGTGDLATAVLDRTAGYGADVILDVVGGSAFDQARRCIAFEGRLVVLGFAGGTIAALPTNHLLLRNYSVVGLHLAAYRRRDPALLRRTHDSLLGLYARAAIGPPVGAVLPFERAPEALDLLSRREVVGRIVLEVEPGS